jgi:large subunit ribosomal protein L43
MPVTPLRLISKSQNGVGAFVLQCKRMEFNYCDWAGSSKGMKSVTFFPASAALEEATLSQVVEYG